MLTFMILQTSINMEINNDKLLISIKFAHNYLRTVRQFIASRMEKKTVIVLQF